MDGNGKIDSYELICALAMLSHATLEEKAELIFNLYDFDGSKYITRDELVILMTNSLAAINQMAKKAPPTMTEIEEKTDKFFKAADTDGDKQITLKEFKAYVTQDKEILEVLLSSNIAKKEDMKMDFGPGTGIAPDVDPDLENECNPKELQRSQKKSNMKEGVDFKVGGDDMFEEQKMGEGDQFMAVKPWLGVVNNSQPSKFKASTRDGDAPDAHLQLEYIYGYRCHDARNNLRYSSNGQVVYHAAGVGIVLDSVNNTQKFFQEHNDDIHCLAIDPTGKYCATGQIGAKPWIFIWNNDTMECISRIQGTLLKGIKTLAFSNNGKYLVASAFDGDHTIAVYEWQAKIKAGQAIKPIACGKGTKANILSIGFNSSDDQIVATCVKEVNFYAFANGIIQGQKGIGWGKSPAEAVMCQAFVDNQLFTGTFSGGIQTWNGRSIASTVKAHSEGVQSMCSRISAKGIITGGGDGLIIVWGWTGQLQKQRSFDLKVSEVKSMLPKARSVCENAQGTILVGTRGGEIMEFAGEKPKILMRSHFDGELWGLCPHPAKKEFITVGQDNMLAIWDIATKRQRKYAKLDCAANVLAYNNDASLLAIGFINGEVKVLDQSFQLVVIRKDRKEAIQEIKFSPDNSICAVGAHDSMIFTYDAKNNFKPLKKMRGHPSTIAHFDFSLDGLKLMSNCTSYNILFFDIKAGKHNPSGASAYKDEPWSSWTCTLGWPVQGIFPPCADGTDINSCDRSPDQTVLATGDDFGMVKLFKYPCPVQKAAFHQSIGHSSHVTNVRFIPKSSHLISTGGEDKCIFQWKYNLDSEGAAQSKKVSQAVVDTTNIENDFVSKDEMFEEQDMGEGDQRLAVKPFLGEVLNSVPSGFKFKPGMADKPAANLKIKYAHGFRSFDTRNNLKYVSNNEIAYCTAALGVVLDKSKNTQRFFNLHEEDIVAFAIHPKKEIIATGQMAAKGKAKFIDIFVWNTQTLECLAQINGFHLRAIRQLAFSPNGDKLLSLGEDDNHSVAVYDWVNKRIICSAKVDQDKIFDAQWKDETEFACVGMKTIKFFTINGANLVGQRGGYGSGGVVATICCAYAFSSKQFLAGSSKGELLQFSGKNISKAIKAHSDALWTINTIQNGAQIVTGGNDAKIIIWDSSLSQKKVIDLAPMSKFQAGVRSLDYNEATKNIIVGTRGSEIIEIGPTGDKLKTLIYGHFEGTKQAELWGLAVHPKNQMFATCGADCTIRIWTENEMVKASEPFANDLTSIDWAKSGDFLVVGDRNGYIYSVDFQTLSKQGIAAGSNANKNNAWVEDVKISPDCQWAIFGAHGGMSLDLVKILDGGKKFLKPISIKLGISSAITHLDWTVDSSTFILNTQAYELMWYDVKAQQRVTASSAKDLVYSTFTSTLGFQVQGIWPAESDYSDVNSTSRSESQTLIATGDDFGKVNLFKYPCVQEHSGCNSYLGHSSHVTKVKFTPKDKFVVSAGGNDKTVIVWETDCSLEIPQQQVQVQIHYDDVDYADYVENKVDRAKIAKQALKENQQLAKPKKGGQQQMDDDFFEVADVGEGDEFAATKPWLGQMREPTGWHKPDKNSSQAPNIQLELEWVHGYRCRDSRNNIQYLVDGSIAYHAAALGVVYDPSNHTQHFFNEHIDDVTAMAFSSDKRTVATGEIGPKPSLYVWDAPSRQIKYKFQGKLQKGIQAISISPSGKTLAAVAIDEDHCVAVYNIETGVLLASDKGDKAWIIDIALQDDTSFCTSGVAHFKQWTIGSTLTFKKGQFGQKDSRHGVCRFNGNQCLTGSITGELYIWQGSSISSSKKLHDKPIDSIYVTSQYVLTGGKDNKVNILDAANYNSIMSFSIDEASYGSICGKVRALCLNQQNNKLLVGTLGSEIYEVGINFQSKQVQLPPKVINQGHYAPSAKDNNEIWGMAIFPKQDQYVTVSDDATLRVWDTQTRKQIKIVKMNLDEKQKEIPMDPKTNEYSDVVKGRCIDISPDGKDCAVGFKNGYFRIYKTDTWELAVRKSAGDKLIQDIKYSKCGKYLAVASHDFKIYVFNTKDMSKKSICKASTAGVTHIDWSLDSKYIHSNDLSYEILYYNAETGEQDKGGASSKRDEVWSTWNLPLGWPVQGIWPAYANGLDINAVARSNAPHHDGYHLIASADDFSTVKVFRYPSTVDKSESIVGKGHSSHVTNVKFSKDDQFLFSAGGNDGCIFQWKVQA